MTSLRADGRAYGALGAVGLPVIDPADIAAVAAHVLKSSGHAGRAYDLTGPESLTSAAQVAILGEVLRCSASYVDVPEADGMLAAGMDAVWTDAMIELIQMLRGLGSLPPTVASGASRQRRAPRRYNARQRARTSGSPRSARP